MKEDILNSESQLIPACPQHKEIKFISQGIQPADLITLKIFYAVMKLESSIKMFVKESTRYAEQNGNVFIISPEESKVLLVVNLSTSYHVLPAQRR